MLCTKCNCDDEVKEDEAGGNSSTHERDTYYAKAMHSCWSNRLYRITYLIKQVLHAATSWGHPRRHNNRRKLSLLVLDLKSMQHSYNLQIIYKINILKQIYILVFLTLWLVNPIITKSVTQ
jgi:hypothetical protein